MTRLFLALLIGLLPASAMAEAWYEGNFIQGGMVIGHTEPGSKVKVEGAPVKVSAEGLFVFGFGRDFKDTVVISVKEPGQKTEKSEFAVEQREYDIQRIDGIAKKYVSPPASTLKKIKADNRKVGAARFVTSDMQHFTSQFIWPSEGRISGVYGSQRVLNGQKKRPHFGLDIAGPTGTPVIAPASGVITLAETGHYYTGGIIIMDHGHGISSTFIHLDTVDVAKGQQIEQGDLIATVGATGRVTGPHLDWRMNWYKQRLDPQLVVPAR